MSLGHQRIRHASGYYEQVSYVAVDLIRAKRDTEILAIIDEEHDDQPDFDGYVPREAWEAALTSVRRRIVESSSGGNPQESR